MKFNLKKSAKYIICTLLTLTVVATVVFLPRFYYSVTDNRDSVGNTAETFKLTADITTSSGGEFLKLVSNEDTVWVLQNNAPKAETVISYAKKAISNLANSLKILQIRLKTQIYFPILQATFRSFLHLTAAAVTNLQCVEHLTVM